MARHRSLAHRRVFPTGIERPWLIVAAAAALTAGTAAVARRWRRYRRGVSKLEELRVRVLAEFHEMPGTVLTLPQASRLWGLSLPLCERLLTSLVSDGVLRNAGGRYMRIESPA